MSDKTKLYPVKGRLVMQENGQPWPEKEGKPIDHEVVMTRYYRRRVADGDLRNKEAEAAERKAAAEAKKLANAADGKPGEKENK